MKIAFSTLGCKVNQFETQAMQRELASRGHTIGSFDEICDAYVVNSCAVTATAEKKSRNALRRARQQNPRAVVAFSGCSGQVHPRTAQQMTEPDIITGTGDRMGLLDALEQTARDGQRRLLTDEITKRRTFEILPAGGLSGRTRALLKVQDGCVNFCSYCIIPYARGPLRSLPLEEAVRQTVLVREAGYRELVITGIEISSWGAERRDGSRLSDLLTAICAAAPTLRIRIGSLEPRTVDRDFCEAIARCPNLCPQFHLSLQSGCDSVLSRMNRKYTTARYLESLALLREYFPACAITTDLIVGFPGETEEEHRTSMAFLRTCGFADVHVFPYSRRSGTPADRMPDQLTAAGKAARAAEAAEVVRELRQAHRTGMIGVAQQVLFEESEGTVWVGHGPDGTLLRADGGGADLHNRILTVLPRECSEDGLIGTLCPPFSVEVS